MICKVWWTIAAISHLLLGGYTPQWKSVIKRELMPPEIDQAYGIIIKEICFQ